MTFEIEVYWLIQHTRCFLAITFLFFNLRKTGHLRLILHFSTEDCKLFSGLMGLTGAARVPGNVQLKLLPLPCDCVAQEHDKVLSLTLKWLILPQGI